MKLPISVMAQYLGSLVVAIGVFLLAGLGWAVVTAGIILIALGTLAEVTS